MAVLTFKNTFMRNLHKNNFITLTLGLGKDYLNTFTWKQNFTGQHVISFTVTLNAGISSLEILSKNMINTFSFPLMSNKCPNFQFFNISFLVFREKRIYPTFGGENILVEFHHYFQLNFHRILFMK
jgi:hypothetical protein